MDLDLLDQDLREIFPSTFSNRGNILVVTGQRDAGKSTYCQTLIKRYHQPGRSISGLLSPGRFTGADKTGYYVIDLASETHRLLASLVPGEIEGFHLGHWVFDTQVLAWGNQKLRQSANANVLVIDELGFLEFDLQTGWTSAFERLKKKDYNLAVVVIRPECIASFTDLGFKFQVKEISAQLPR
ncbi:MAG: nucleoside-triphosphatase [Anaerolineaceae bacterium]|nr:nucleoside-triphosphatase [Anaerolineaceae bacterium]